MAYADLAAVRARAGRISPAWTLDSNPSTQDVEVFLEDVSAEIDAALDGLGFSVPLDDAVAIGALKGINADGALILAVEATFPNNEGPAAAAALLEAARARYDAAWTQLVAGTLPAVKALKQDEAPVSLAATNFWDQDPAEEPLIYTAAAQRWLLPDYLARRPEFRRGMRY